MSLSAEEVLALFRRTGVLREGHFLLTSGLHSDRFLLCAQALQYPAEAERLCRALAETWQGQGIDVVAGPAVGGIIMAYETARHLGARAVFTEKTEDGGMALRRGFQVRPGERVLLVEDAVTTGGSVLKCKAALEPFQPQFVGVAALVDRSGGQAHLDGLPLRALLRLDIPAYPPGDCPLCARGEPLVRPKG